MSTTELQEYNSITHNIFNNELTVEEPNHTGLPNLKATIIACGSENKTNEEIIYCYENFSSDNICIRGQFSTNLKPGKRIVVRTEGLANETQVLERIKMANTDYTNLNTSERNLDLIKRFQKWMKVSQRQIDEKVKIIREKDDIINKQEAEIAKCNEELIMVERKANSLLKEKEVNAVIFKYGVIPYSIFLIISATLFFSSIVAFAMWRTTGVTIFNPAGLFMTIIMSLGWGLTALVGIVNFMKRSDGRGSY